MFYEREISNEENVAALNIFFNRNANTEVKVVDTKVVDNKVIAVISSE
jgi:hypothetical protein